jgi:superfamily II RNA helicase
MQSIVCLFLLQPVQEKHSSRKYFLTSGLCHEITAASLYGYQLRAKFLFRFYAMKQVLQGDDDGVLVYVAPTKALVNQIAAEIQARFSKSYPNKLSGKSVWAIHTRDYRINNPTNCQILVTMPHILQIMLLAPANAKTWASQIKRIIFDKIHCIGQANDGVVWEQLLLLSPCPIIALSATVDSTQRFH